MRVAHRLLAIALLGLALVAGAPRPAHAILLGTFTSPNETFTWTDLEPGFPLAFGQFTAAPVSVVFTFNPAILGLPAGAAGSTPIAAVLTLGAVLAQDPATGGATIIQPLNPGLVSFQIVSTAPVAGATPPGTNLLSGAFATSSILASATGASLTSLVLSSLTSDVIPGLAPNGGPGTLDFTISGPVPTLTNTLLDSFTALLTTGTFFGNAPAAVPEPSSFAIAGVGGFALLVLARRRRTKAAA